jgi:hypothetical protein
MEIQGVFEDEEMIGGPDGRRVKRTPNVADVATLPTRYRLL